MGRPRDSRARALQTAERLFRTQGFAATGLAQIIAESGSPKGSFYFHFPGGKDQLAAEAVAGFAARTGAAIGSIAKAVPGDAAGFVRLLCAAIADEMQQADHALGCVLQNIAAEKAPADPVMTQLLAAGFDSWLSAVSDHFAACGVDQPGARALALVAALEGARTIARVQRNSSVFTAVADSFATALTR